MLQQHSLLYALKLIAQILQHIERASHLAIKDPANKAMPCFSSQPRLQRSLCENTDESHHTIDIVVS